MHKRLPFQEFVVVDLLPNGDLIVKQKLKTDEVDLFMENEKDLHLVFNRARTRYFIGDTIMGQPVKKSYILIPD